MALKSLSFLTLIATIGLLGGIHIPPTFAQSTPINPLSDLQTQDGGTGVFSGSSGQSAFFDLMHNLQRGAHLKNPEQFQIEQQQNLEDAAAQFRQRQRELLKNPATTDQPHPDSSQ